MKAFLQSLKRSFYSLRPAIMRRKNISADFPRFPQTYKASYEVTLTNVSDAEKRFFLVLPVPPDTATQHITKQPEFYPKNFTMRREKRFSNQYVFFDVAMKPSEKKMFKNSFEVSVLPSRPALQRKFSFDDYEKLDPALREKFCSKNRYIRCDDDKIQRLAHELHAVEDNVIPVLERINKYVSLDIRYGNPIPGLYSSEDALARDMVDCGGFGCLFAAICAALNIPARIVPGFFAGYEKNEMHAWVEVLLPDNTWLPADPSLEQLFLQGKTQKFGMFGNIGSDRVAFSAGCDLVIDVEDKIYSLDILQNPFFACEADTDGIEVETRFFTKRT